MSLESDLYARLSSLVSGRMYPDVLPLGASLPAIVYQQVGGQPIAFVSAEKPSKKHARIQVRCWAASRAAVASLARSVEDSMITWTPMPASAENAPIADHDAELQHFGTIQDFSIWFDD